MFAYKSILYCKTRKTEIRTIKVNISVLACTLFVSVDDKLASILPYHRKHQCLWVFCLKNQPQKRHRI